MFALLAAAPRLDGLPLAVVVALRRDSEPPVDLNLATSTVAGGGAVFTRSTVALTVRLRPHLPLSSTCTHLVRLDDIFPAVLVRLHRGEGRAAERLVVRSRRQVLPTRGLRQAEGGAPRVAAEHSALRVRFARLLAAALRHDGLPLAAVVALRRDSDTPVELERTGG